jgi:hypothetical protein
MARRNEAKGALQDMHLTPKVNEKLADHSEGRNRAIQDTRKGREDL